MTQLIAALLILNQGAAQTPSSISIDPTFRMGKRVSSGHPEKLGPDAFWIWTKRVADKQNVTLSKDFTISGPVRDARIFLSVDNFYKLSLDGALLGSTMPETDDVDGWRTAKVYEVTPRLTPGKHHVEIKAYNAASAAGALFRLEVNNKPVLLSDGDWQAVDDSAGTGPEKATVEAKGGQGAWGEDISGWPAPFQGPPGYLAHMPIAPVMVSTDGNYSDPDHLNWSPTSKTMELTNPTPGKDWKVIVDFGQELTGRVIVHSKSECKLTVGTGESTGEAIEKPYTQVSLSLDGKNSGNTRYSAFRYASFVFPASESSASLEVNLDHLYYPVNYVGSFDCSDPLLTKLWYTGAYTCHLCMQQDIWDAPKRDRLRWMGDLHVSGEVINNVFADKFLMEQTLTRLRDDAQGGNAPDQLPQGHVNGIPGYSCAWLAGMADFYKHTGDLEFVKKNKEAIVTLIEYFRGELGPDGTFANKRGAWPFVDWSDDFDKDTPETKASTHFFMVKAIADGAYLLRECGDTADADKYAQWSEELKTLGQTKFVGESGTFGMRRQENAMAVFSGVATDAQRQAIYQEVLNPSSASWKKDATPYYNNYVIFALSQLGHGQDAMNFVRDYWGGMIREGATTFWEGYDTSWDKHNSHVHLQADDGTGYFVSLCHGWSAGVTNWLTEEVAGIRPLTGGFHDCLISPELGDLSYVNVSVPTPSGSIIAKIQKSGTGYQIDLVVPKSVAKAHVSVKGENISKVGQATGSTELVLGPGHYHLEAK